MASTPEIEEIEQAASAAGIDMAVILAQAGVATTTWWRWRKKDGATSPRLVTLQRVRDAVSAAQQQAAA